MRGHLAFYAIDKVCSSCYFQVRFLEESEPGNPGVVVRTFNTVDHYTGEGAVADEVESRFG
jgi:hypothetical protein